MAGRREKTMYSGIGRVMKNIGGLFTVRLLSRASADFPQDREDQPLDGQTVSARGRGNLHRKGALLVGDLVEVSYDAFLCRTADAPTLTADGGGVSIDRVLERSSALIRPPVANLHTLFVTFSAASPAPDPDVIDKLIAIAEHNRIEPVILVTKRDLAPDVADRMAGLYRAAGFAVFCSGEGCGDPPELIRDYINTNLRGRIAAVSGASGIGKSSLLNRLYPDLCLETGEISRRIERGKNTTRAVELFPLTDEADSPLLADTPGFTMLDFEHFDFMEKEDLPLAFREFAPYLGKCRYTKCTHTKEDGCAVLQAVRDGKIAPSRHAGFVALYEILKKKPKWEKPAPAKR